MEVKYTKKAEIDIFFWVKSGNKSILKRIDLLIDSIKESPFIGIGKPEPLKYQLAGKWSRRINSEHRLVYEIVNGEIVIFSAKGHYD
jgi:toxin YoeB